MAESNPSTSIVANTPANNIQWQIRPYQESDFQAMRAVWNAIWKADGLDFVTSEEELRIELSRPEFDPAKQVIIVEGPQIEGLPEGMLPGVGVLNIRDDEQANERIYDLEVAVYPVIRPTGLERVLAERLVEMARSHEQEPDVPAMSKIRMKSGASDKQPHLKALYESMGMREVRQFWLMACPLTDIDEPPVVDGATLRNYRYPEDNEAALEAFNNSFSDHYDFHPSSLERWVHRIGSSRARHDLSWLAEINDKPGKIAGFCICGISEEENAATGRHEGWIDLLGTIRGWRRVGLGRALLLNGMMSLRSAGMDTAMLGVDAESLTGANRLYETVGFRIRYVWISLECLLSEIKGTRSQESGVSSHESLTPDS